MKLNLRPRGVGSFPIYWAILAEFANDANERLASLEPQFQARSGRGGWSEEAGYEVVDGIAQINLSGPLTKVASCYSYFFGGTSTVETRQTLADAIRDPKVKGVCFLVDSPGGEVAGTGELARDIARFKTQKPIYAYVDDLCCSAAMWIASQCDAIYANPESIIGSIGVVMSVTDSSEAHNRAGVKKIVIGTDDHKGAGTPGTVITEAHKAEWKRNIDSIGAEFDAAVKAGRRLTDKQLAAVSDARVHVGAEAQALGLVDGICSLDECLAKLQAVADQRGTTKTTGSKAGLEETSMMKMTIATALSALGMHGMAARVLSASDDNAESVGPKLAEGVKAEVDAQIAAHPLLGPLEAAGIKTPDALATLQQEAGWGKAYVADLRGAAEKAAVTASGVDTPEGLAQVESAKALIANAGPDLLKAYTGQWNAMAKAKGLQSTDGKPMPRQSAAPALANDKSEQSNASADADAQPDVVEAHLREREAAQAKQTNALRK